MEKMKTLEENIRKTSASFEDKVSQNSQPRLNLKMSRLEVWEYYYQLAFTYFNATDTLKSNLSQVISEDNPNYGVLNCWLKVQKIRLRDGSLSKDQIEKLEKLNINWYPLSKAAKRKLALKAVKAYFKEHHNLLIPSNYTVEIAFGEKMNLSTWLHNQRSYYLKGMLKQEEIDELNKMGMIWQCRDDMWYKHYEEIVKYYKTYGHINFPISLRLGTGIYNFSPNDFIIKERKKYQEGKLSLEKTKLLETLGISWDLEVSTFFGKYNYLRTYYQENGHLNIPVSLEVEYLPGKKFKPRLWIRNLRNAYNKNELSPEEIELFNEIGMIWDTKTDKREKVYLINFYHLEKSANAKALLNYSLLELNARICFCNQKRQALIGKNNILNKILTKSRSDFQRDYQVSLDDLIKEFKGNLKVIRQEKR